MVKTVLVIVAHPDDEVLSCGGTIAKHVRKGDKVVVAILGQGKASRQSGGNTRGLKKEISILKQESKNANKILGVQETSYHNFPDNAIDTIPLLDVIQYIEGLKKKYVPDIVYTHHHLDINIDHQLIFKAVMTAFRPIKNDYVPFIYACEVPSATEWQAPNTGLGFQPNVFVDIGDTLEIKKQALAAYKSELRNYPHPRSIEAIDVIARRWGIMVGFEAAEPFVLVRSVLKDIGCGSYFVIRNVSEEDEQDILTWRNDRLAREMSERQTPISPEEHSVWFKNKLRNPNSRIYIALGDLGKKIGMIRFDRQDKNNKARVSINIAPEFRGKGFGREILQRGIEIFLTGLPDVNTLEAIIKKENVVSEYIFKKNGFSDARPSRIKGFVKVTYKKHS